MGEVASQISDFTCDLKKKNLLILTIIFYVFNLILIKSLSYSYKKLRFLFYKEVTKATQLK